MMDIEKYLNNFSKYHGLIANVEIFDSLHVKDKQLRRIIKLYQEKYNADLDCVCLFNESDIEMISESVINHNLRKNIHNGVIPVNILSLNNDYLLRNDIFRISEIATTYLPGDADVRVRYRKHFSLIVKRLYHHFKEKNKNHADYILPLRSAQFVYNNSFSIETDINVVKIHTKRLYSGSNILAVGIDGFDVDLLTNENLVICEGGIVTGFTIISILEKLKSENKIPKKVSIFCVHAAFYGITNIINRALVLGISVEFWIAMTSFAIGKSFYAYYDYEPWRTGSLVTGDVGDFLEGP